MEAAEKVFPIMQHNSIYSTLPAWPMHLSFSPLGLNRDILHDVTVMSDVLSRMSQHFDKLM